MGTITPNFLVEEIPNRIYEMVFTLENWVTFCCSMNILAELSIKLWDLLLSLPSPQNRAGCFMHLRVKNDGAVIAVIQVLSILMWLAQS